MSQSTALVARMPRPAAGSHISPANWQLLTDVIFPAARDPLMVVTAYNYCVARRLDPLKRPIHIVPVYSRAARKKVEQIWPGIGELEITAARSNCWAGMDAPQWGPLLKRTFKGSFENDDGTTRQQEITVEFPEWCRVNVWRFVREQRFSFCEEVFWLEAYGRAAFRSELPKDMWAQRPRGQLAKCALAASLRAAFPEDIGHDYASVEMEGHEIDIAPTIDVQPEPPSDSSALTSNGPWQEPANGNGQPDREGWTQLDYPVKRPDGSVHIVHTGTDYITDWHTGIERLRDRPDILARVREGNKASFAVVASFDPQAAAEVEAMLDAALNKTG